MKKHKANIKGVIEMNESLGSELADAMDDLSNILRHHETADCVKTMLAIALAKLANANFTSNCIIAELAD